MPASRISRKKELIAASGIRESAFSITPPAISALRRSGEKALDIDMLALGLRTAIYSRTGARGTKRFSSPHHFALKYPTGARGCETPVFPSSKVRAKRAPNFGRVRLCGFDVEGIGIVEARETFDLK